jgi:hypothetical protein
MTKARKAATKPAAKAGAKPASHKAPDSGAHICPGRGAPCGTDLGPLIAKGPKDGCEHMVACPNCHTLHGYVAPVSR